MAFKASNQLPTDGLVRAKRLANQTKLYLQGRRGTFLLPTTAADVLLATFHDLRRTLIEFDEIGAIPGLAQYARDQEVDSGYDIVAEFVAMDTAISDVMALIKSAFPVDGSGYILDKKWAIDDTYEFRSFSAAALTPLVALIDTAILTIA